MKKSLFGLFMSLWTSLAWAGVSCTMPFTFTPGTLADANQVNANYAAVVACLLNAAAAGANNDITSLLALTTPISPAGGGTTVYVGGTSGGSANAQTVGTLVPTGFAKTAGNSVVFIAGFTNTGATQININSTGLTNFYRQTPDGPQAMTGGEIKVNQLIYAFYDGTQYQMVSNGPQFGGYGPLTTLASAATADLGTIASHNVTFSGAVTITSFGSSASTTFPFYQLNFTTALVLTHNATSLILPGAANITTASGDEAVAMYLGGGNWQVVSYTKALGTAVISPIPLCGFSGLSVSTVSDTQINWSFNNSVLLTTGNVPLYSGSKSGSVTVTTGTGGTATAGGMDGSAPSANAFIYLYAISDGSTWNAMGSNTVPSTFVAAPNFPSGYKYICYMGAMKALNSTHVYGTVISGPEARYVVGGGSLATTLPTIDSGLTKGTLCLGGTTYVTETIRGNSGAGIWMPSTSVRGDFVVTASGASAALAANATYTGTSGGQNLQTSAAASLSVSILMESNAVFWCNVTNAASLFQYGWKDAVNAN